MASALGNFEKLAKRVVAEGRACLNTRDEGEYYRAFLRLVQVTAIGYWGWLAFYAITMLFVVGPVLADYWLYWSVMGSSLVYTVVEVLVAEFALAKIQEKKFVGIGLGLVLALLKLPSLFLLLGLFGLYALLNKEFQKKYYVDCPPLYLDLLKKVKLR